MISMELHKAILCLDCNMIYAAGFCCPRCGSAQGYRLADWIKEPMLETPININTKENMVWKSNRVMS